MNRDSPSARGVVPAPAVHLLRAVADIARYVERSGGFVVAVCIDGATGPLELSADEGPSGARPEPIATDQRTPSTEHQP